MHIRILFAVGLLYGSMTAFSQSPPQEVMTNRSVIGLLQMGLNPSTVLAKINSTPCFFNVQTDSLVYLKANKVPDFLIDAMIQRQEQMDILARNDPAMYKKLKPTDPGNKDSQFQESGIYYYDSGPDRYILIDPTATSGMTVSNSTNESFGVRYGNVTTRATIGGKEASLSIHSHNPVFYFYLDPTVTTGENPGNYLDNLQSGNQGTAANAVVISPNDLKLIHLKTSKYERSFVCRKANAYGRLSRGIDPKQLEVFRYEQVRPNVYRIYFDKGLVAGEYCFFYSGNTVAESSRNFGEMSQVKVFDFGIGK